MRVLITASVQSHICQFHKNLIINLRKNGYEVHVAARNNLAEKNGLALDFADKVHNIPFDRSPFNFKRNIKAYKELKKLLTKESYDIIHCNTAVGGILTRLAARKYRKKGTKVIYMAHGFYFYKGSSVKNWIFYPVEKIFGRLTDVLVTINKEDYALAKEKFNIPKIEYVPGIGIDIERFSNCVVDKKVKREEIGIPEGYTWLLSVGELLPDKNHASIMKAIADIPNVYYTVAGNGRLDIELEALAKELKIEDRFKLLGYRLDVPELCNCADIFAFPSKFEGLPVALMEAMASGMAVVCSEVRGCTDLIDPNGGILVEPYNIEQISKAIKQLILEDTSSMKKYNLKKIQEFSKERVVEKMLKIYSEA